MYEGGYWHIRVRGQAQAPKYDKLHNNTVEIMISEKNILETRSCTLSVSSSLAALIRLTKLQKVAHVSYMSITQCSESRGHSHSTMLVHIVTRSSFYF